MIRDPAAQRDIEAASAYAIGPPGGDARRERRRSRRRPRDRIRDGSGETARPALLALASVLALALAPSALAHDGGRAGYESTVIAIEPELSGIRIEVVNRDDRLRLTSSLDAEIVIFGYGGEPYLRFTPDGVDRNVHSPATYLNEVRLGEIELPPQANATATPKWERVAGRPSFEWHDHRIHWMSAIDPPLVQADPGTPRKLFDWTVQGTVDGRPLTIRGRLDYRPPPGRPDAIVIALSLAGLAGVGGLLVALRRLGFRRQAATHPGIPSSSEPRDGATRRDSR